VKKVLSFLKYLFLSVAALVSVFPLLWMVIAATNKSIDVIRGKLSFGSELFNNLSALTKNTNLVPSLMNTLKFSAIQTVISVIVCAIAGYGFVVYRDKRKDRLFKILLLSMMVPLSAVIIPLFRMFAEADLLDTIIAFALPNVSTAFLILFFRQNSMTFPQEIIQSARVDGLGEFGIFSRIYVPIMKPVFAAAITITFMTAWNSYLWPLIVMQTEKMQTLPLMIASFNGRPNVDYGQLMLSLCVCTLPTVILFFVLQKSFVKGMLGSVKG